MGYRKDANYPPDASPSIGGLGAGIEVSSISSQRRALTSPRSRCPTARRRSLFPGDFTHRRRLALRLVDRRGGIPAGLSLSASGVLSGTPTTAGIYSFNIVVTDANGTGVSDTQSYTVAIYAALTINALTLIDAEWVIPTAAPAATGGSGGNAWLESLRPGVDAGFRGGGLTGTPPATGTAALTASVTDSLGGGDSHLYNTITVQPAVAITSAFASRNGQRRRGLQLHLHPERRRGRIRWDRSPASSPTG